MLIRIDPMACCRLGSESMFCCAEVSPFLQKVEQPKPYHSLERPAWHKESSEISPSDDLVGKEQQILRQNADATSPKACGLAESFLANGESICTTASTDTGTATAASEDESYSPGTGSSPVGKSRRRSRDDFLCVEQDEAVGAMLKGLRERFDALDALGGSTCSRNSGSSWAPMMSLNSNASGDTNVDFVRLMSPQEFNSFLQYYGVDLSAFDSSKARSLRDLWLEVIWQTTNLEKYPCADGPDGFRIKRLVKLLAVKLEASINGETRHLMLSSEDHRKNLNQRLTTKMFSDEGDEDSLVRCMMQNFGMKPGTVWNHMSITEATQHEEVKDSPTYPGLRTFYDIHTLTVCIHYPNSPELAIIGLPDAQDFKTERAGTALQKQVRTWIWVDTTTFENMTRLTTGTVTQPIRKLSKEGEDKAVQKCCIIS